MREGLYERERKGERRVDGIVRGQPIETCNDLYLLSGRGERV